MVDVVTIILGLLSVGCIAGAFLLWRKSTKQPGGRE